MTNNHPANHWTNYLPFPGLDSIAKKAIFIPKAGETLQVCNKRWALFFNTLGLTVTRSPDAASIAFNQALLDTLFCDGGECSVVSDFGIRPDGSLSIVRLSCGASQQVINYAFYASGYVEREEHWTDDKKHRLDGPAVIWYFASGSVWWENYWVDGKRHRLDGPAVIWYREDGSVKWEEYWVDSEEVTNAVELKAFRLRTIGHALGNCTIQQSAGVINI